MDKLKVMDLYGGSSGKHVDKFIDNTRSSLVVNKPF